MVRYCLYGLRCGGWLALLLWVLGGSATPIHAHGGTLIASGASADGRYGWMLSASPYPVVTGPVTFSLLVFDTQSSALINTVAGELYIAAPDSPRPCCEPALHQGPFPLLLEPFQYSDYIAYVPVDQVGAWEVQFRLKIADDSLTLAAPFEVVGAGGLTQAAIQTAVNELTESTRQQTLAVTQVVSPLPSPIPVSVAVQAPSPLLSPLATPTLSPAVALPAPPDLPQAAPTPIWLVGGGLGAIIAGVGLVWWRSRKKS